MRVCNSAKKGKKEKRREKERKIMQKEKNSTAKSRAEWEFVKKSPVSGG